MSDRGSMQAFPVQDQGVHGSYGLTIREHFAAMAMQGLATNWIQGWATAIREGRFDPDNPRTAPQDLARWSVCAADALLAALAFRPADSPKEEKPDAR